MKNQIQPRPGLRKQQTLRMATRTLDAHVTQGGWDPPRVLVVDDNPANLLAFEAILSEPGFELVIAQSGAEAIRELLTGTFAVILLDINMPHLDGLETASLIRKRDRCKDIPIILVTAYTPDQTQLLRGYECGAVDYLVKPLVPEILRYKVRVFVELFRKSHQIEYQASQLRAVNVQLQHEMNQRREAERDAAFEREERQRVALSSIADAVVTLDPYGHVTSLNAQAEQLTGWRSEAARGLALSEVVACGDTPHSLAQIAKSVMTSDRSVRSEAPMPFVDGNGSARFIEYGISPVHDRRGAVVVGAVLIIQDVTSRHCAEMEREHALRREQTARRAAEEANRARDEFLSVISHELRTPLNAIVGWAQILQTGKADAEQSARAVAAIHRSAMAQKKLIEDLLDMSRIINGKIELNRTHVDLAQIVRTAVETVQPLAGEKALELTCGIDDAAFPVHADSSRIQQVLWNLLSNAVKFTPQGGRVKLQLQRDETSAKISVSDTGEGIEPMFLNQVFEAFRQADSSTARAHGGLGLGLTISRTLVTMHGGTIEARSDGPGCGACFTVTLPLLEAPAALPSDTNGDKLPHASLARLRVLVVDDDPSTREMVGLVIAEQGAQVQVAADVGEALNVIAAWQPDVLLSDISMPGEDGYSLIARVRAMPVEKLRTMPAIAITAMASEEDRLAALHAGFQAHVTKPLHFPTLVEVISRLVPSEASR
ncbi:MAG TPA: response regulator [Burkholderiales bacterium]|nr:response regulator [Burkholderiales bacterium]